MSALLASVAIALAGLCVAAQDVPDTILLVGGRSFGESQHVADALNGMLAASGVLGPSRVALLPGWEANDEGLSEQFAKGPTPRALFVIVGNLSILQNIDPSRPIPTAPKELSSREIDLAALGRQLDELVMAAGRMDTPLVFVTAPLGKQGRLETPELLSVAQALRTRSPLLDLAADFRERENLALFENGVDSLNAWGREAAARRLFDALCRDETLVPARTQAERAARASQRALSAWAQADHEAFERLTAEALEFAAETPNEAGRHAALRTARDGLRNSAQHWLAVGEGTRPTLEGSVPGLAVARLLLGPPEAALHSDDPFEQQFLHVASQLAAGQTGAAARASREQVSTTPHRVESWIALQIAALVTDSNTQDTLVEIGGPSPEEALASVGLVTSGPLSLARQADLISMGWQAAELLPVTLTVEAPFRHLEPHGPAQAALHRRFGIKMRHSALNLWAHDVRGALVPPAWKDALEQLRGGRSPR